MKEIKITRDLFLWGMSIIYLSAFSSLYHQIPGLYGDNGIMPAHSKIPLEANATTTNKKVDETLSLLWLAPALGIDIPLAMDLLALLGIVISLGCMVWGRMRDMTNFTLLWMLYFSLYQVGQTFMSFQWDILLLEAGFITILVAPLGLLHHKVEGKLLPSLPHRPHDTVTLFLVRWLLFRFMFAAGVVKLTSNCPTWWSLTALNYHFESQCIPTSFAWYAHHLPKWMLRLSVVNTFLIEIAVPFLFFMPLRSLRIFSCIIQIFFQISIMLTGNFNFFNLLTITLCVSLMDDELLLIFDGKVTTDSNRTSAGLKYTKFFIFSVIEFVVLFGLAYWTVYFFSLQIQPDGTIDSQIAFSPTEFRKALSTVMPITIAIGVISLIANILLAFYRSLTEEEEGGFAKLYNLLGTLCVSFVAIWLFLVSLVPHASLDVKTQRSLWPIIDEWYYRVDEFQIANAYGLFRRMTGTNGRPELIIEGSNSLASGWKEYHFLYKPGDIAQRPSFIIPHQPRLDWQMWFAALSSFEYNPWFVSFVYRLLEGKQEVLRLLDEERLPFSASRPPKYIRAVLYKYSYTSLRRINSTANWWTRKREAEYCSTANFDKRQVADYLEDTGIHLEKKKHMIVSNIFMKRILLKIRHYVESVSATSFIWSLLGTGLSLNFLGPFLRCL